MTNLNFRSADAGLESDAGWMRYRLVTRFDGSAITNEYDQAGRLNYVLYSSASVPLASVDYTYYPDGQLQSISDGTSSNTYSYDALNRLSSVTNSVSSVVNYLHDAVGNLTNTMVSIGGAQASATYYAIKDHQNTVLALVDETGTVVESYDYDAYGRTKVFSATGTELTASAYGNRYTFQGREIDWATGLIYFRARWYNPVVGKWLSKDPIGIAGGMNLYAFVDNNPVNFTDPSGLCEEAEIDKSLLLAFWIWYANYFGPMTPPDPPPPEPPPKNLPASSSGSPGGDGDGDGVGMSTPLGLLPLDSPVGNGPGFSPVVPILLIPIGGGGGVIRGGGGGGGGGFREPIYIGPYRDPF